MAARPRRRQSVPKFDAGWAVSLILQGYASYLHRSQAEEAPDAKAFAALHAAGRAALAHAEHVLKVAAMVGGEEAGPDLAALLAAARASLGEADSDEENDSDDLAGGTV